MNRQFNPYAPPASEVATVQADRPVVPGERGWHDSIPRTFVVLTKPPVA